MLRNQHNNIKHLLYKKRCFYGIFIVQVKQLVLYLSVIFLCLPQILKKDEIGRAHV